MFDKVVNSGFLDFQRCVHAVPGKLGSVLEVSLYCEGGYGSLVGQVFRLVRVCRHRLLGR